MRIIEQLKALFTGRNLKARAARASLWLGGASTFDQLTRFVRQVILVRILAPADFGLMALVIAASRAFDTFTEVGVRQCLVQSKSGGTDEFLNAAWWSSMARGVMLYVVGLLMAPYVCRFYDRPDLLPLLQVAFSTMILNGAISPRLYLLQKGFQFSRWVVVMQGGGLAAVFVSTVAAFWLRNVWALVLGIVLESFARTVLSHVMCPFVPRFRLHRESMREIMAFARGMFGLPVWMMIFAQAPLFVLPKMFPDATVGRYKVAMDLSRMPLLIFNGTILPLILPAFSRFKDDPERLRAVVRDMVRVVMVITTPITVFLIVFAEPVMLLVYGPKYSGMATVLSLLASGTLITMLNTCVVSVFLSQGVPGIHTRYSALRAIIVAAIIWPMIRLVGVEGAPIAVLIALVGVFVFQQNRLETLIGISWRDVLSGALPGVLSGAAALACSLALRALLSGPLYVIVGAGGAVCAAAVALGTTRILGQGVQAK